MQCVNPQCRREAHDIQTGTLRLLELAVPPENRVVRPEGGFPVVVVPSRFFWLCAQCSRIWRIKRWTPEGLLLEPNPPHGGQTLLLQMVKVPPAMQKVQGPVKERSQRAG